MADTQTFQSVDAAKWKRIKAAVLAKVGIDIELNTGAGSAKGISISWSYSPDTSTLIVTLVKRSFYDPSEAAIDNDIAAWIKAA